MDHAMRTDEAAGNAPCVARVPLFQGLTFDEQLDVATVARPRRLTEGQLVCSAGANASQLIVVHTGRIKISRISDGDEQIVRVLEPGDFVGESAFLTGRPPDHVATAIEAGSVCVFDHADLGDLVRAHPSVGIRMLQAVSRRLQETETRLASVIFGDVSSRLADYLLSLPARPSGEGLEVELPLAKKDIASLLDTTPESLSRQLRRLQDSGVTSAQGARRLAIRDVDTLMELQTRP